MSIPLTPTSNVHGIFPDQEEKYSTRSVSPCMNKTAIVLGEDQSIQREKYPPSYKTIRHENNGIDSIGTQELIVIENTDLGNTHDDTESVLVKKKRRWIAFRRIVYILVMNAAIPIALYYILKSHFPAVWALVLSSTPTIISVIVQAMFMKRIDSIGVVVVFGFVLSFILAILNGDPKMLLMRESFVTAGMGIICAITLLPIKYKSFVLKPIICYLASDLIPMEPIYFLDKTKQPQKRMDFYWRYSAFCRFHFRILTAINVVILELEFGLKLYYILTFDIDTVVVLSNSTLSLIGIIMSLSTIGYIMQIRKRLRKDEPEMLKNALAVDQS